VLAKFRAITVPSKYPVTICFTNYIAYYIEKTVHGLANVV